MTKKGFFSKLIILTVVVLNSAFTVAVLYTFLKVGDEPTALIAAWFAFTTGELWLLSQVKKTKIKEASNKEDFDYEYSNNKKETYKP